MAIAIVFIGLLSIAFRLEKTAYRYASVTLAIIVLIPRSGAAWIIALHRFLEVSVGIIVALSVVVVAGTSAKGSKDPRRMICAAGWQSVSKRTDYFGGV